jgi:hypothetical protein
MPTPKQMEKLAAEQARALARNEPAPDAPTPESWWESVLSDPRAAGKPWLPITAPAIGNPPASVPH